MSFLDPASHIAADLLLHRIEQELANCRGILIRVEAAVETLLKSGHVALDDPLHVVEMQNIDLLDQIIADLMLCLQDFSLTDAIESAPSVRLGQVTRRLRLEAVRNRLGGFAAAPDPGDGVELF